MTYPLQDHRYGTPTNLTFSQLSTFASYDRFGNVVYNLFDYLQKPIVDSDAVTIGRIVDEVITDDIDFEGTYTNESNDKTVDWYKERLALYIEENKDTVKGTSKWKKADWMQLHEQVYPDYTPDTRTYLAPAVYDTIVRVVESLKAMPYSPKESLLEFLGQCETQTILEDQNRHRKGKTDIIHRARKVISDLKCVGNLDKVLEAVQFRGVFNLTYRYIRQLAWYNDLAGGGYDGELVVVDHKCRHIVIHIPNALLRRAQELNERDVKELNYRLMQPSYTSMFVAPEEGTYGSASFTSLWDVNDDSFDI